MSETAAKWIACGLLSIAWAMALSTASTPVDPGSTRYQIEYEEINGRLRPAYLFNTRTGEVHRRGPHSWRECQEKKDY
jgi:hypothetical protein